MFQQKMTYVNVAQFRSNMQRRSPIGLMKGQVFEVESSSKRLSNLIGVDSSALQEEFCSNGIVVQGTCNIKRRESGVVSACRIKLFPDDKLTDKCQITSHSCHVKESVPIGVDSFFVWMIIIRRR